MTVRFVEKYINKNTERNLVASRLSHTRGWHKANGLKEFYELSLINSFLKYLMKHGINMINPLLCLNPSVTFK